MNQRIQNVHEGGRHKLSPKMAEVLSLARQCEERPLNFYRDPRQAKAWSKIVGRWMLPSSPAMSLRALKERGLATREFHAWLGRLWFLTEDGLALICAAQNLGSRQ